MQNNWIFDYFDYRQVLERQIEKEKEARGYRTLMARAAGCQPAYLSQVLSGKVQLTPEQASGLCDFWRLSELEGDYFLTLVHLGRSGREGLNDRLTRKLYRLRTQYEDGKASSIQVEKETYEREKALFYYLDWVASAVHLCLMIPGYDRPGSIARRLRVDEGVILNTLRTLEDLGIARKMDSGWSHTAKTLHTADESLFAPHHHRNWREKAAEYYRHGRLVSNLHYTSVYCLDRQTFTKIRQELSRVIEASRRSAIPAPEETIACMNVDWFEI